MLADMVAKRAVSTASKAPAAPRKGTIRSTAAPAAASRGRRAPAPPVPAPSRRREFAAGQFPPDRYRLVEIELDESLADWIMSRRKATPPVPYAQLAHELINATGLQITNEAVRRWAQHLEAHPEDRHPFTQVGRKAA
jgi:hypothetical protein